MKVLVAVWIIFTVALAVVLIFGRGIQVARPPWVLNALLVVFTGALVIVGAMQWRAIRQTVETSERAWVTVKSATLSRSLALGESPIVTLEITNSGRSPALEAIVAGNVFSRSILTDKDLSDAISGESGSRMVIGADTVVTVLLDTSEPVSRQEQIDAIRTGPSRLYATGIITYRDIFQRLHRTRFCFVLKGSDVAGVSLAACDRWNTAD